MKSNPKNICIDTNQLTKAYPETRFEFHTYNNFGRSQLLSATVDTLPNADKSKRNLDHVWRICMGGIDPYINDGNVLKQFDDFKDRSSYNASFTTVVYAGEVEDSPTDNPFNKTAPISIFMQDIADTIHTGLDKETPFYLNAEHDATIERFEFSKETGELVSQPFHDSKYTPVQSRDGLMILEEYLGQHADRFRGAQFDSFLKDYISATVKILQAADYKIDDPYSDTQDKATEFKDQQDIICLSHVQRADTVLKFIRDERENLPEPKPAWKPPGWKV